MGIAYPSLSYRIYNTHFPIPNQTQSAGFPLVEIKSSYAREIKHSINLNYKFECDFVIVTLYIC